MADPDVILYMYPNDGVAGQADHSIKMSENKSRLLPPRRGAASNPSEPNATPGRGERENTAPPGERSTLEDMRCLAVRFSDSARSRFGVVVGSNRDANLILEDEKGVSGFHFAFTFDGQNRPIVRDLGSTFGTRVSYDEEDERPRKNFDWLLQGPRLSGPRKSPVLSVTNDMHFRIVVPPHDTKSPDYTARVARFREGKEETEVLLKALTVKSRNATRAPTEAQTPLDHSGAVMFRRVVAEGSFGKVTYAWNTTTGDEYALKEPKEDFRLWDWKKEVDIMESISHKHIVAFYGATWTPHPQLRLEFMPEGSLKEHKDFSTLENTQILEQLLSALQYLHGFNPPIGHRDIKPANILVKHRHVGDIYVKFADFGLAKAGEQLYSVCGTRPWAAPELYSRFGVKHAVAGEWYGVGVGVDIYSCGLVVASQECGLPDYLEEYDKSDTAWINAVLAHVQRRAEGSDLLSFLLRNMLVIDPQKRQNASVCHDRAELLGRIAGSNSNGSTSSDADESNSEDDEGTPSPSIHKGGRVTNYSGLDGASTVRPKYQITSPDSSLIADLGYRGSSKIDSITNQTEYQISQDSGAPSPASRQLHRPVGPAIAESEKSTLDDVVWGPQVENYVAAPVEGGGPQAEDTYFRVRHYLGGEVQDQARIPRQASLAAEGGTQQSARKRARPGRRASLLSARQLHTNPPSDVEAASRDNQEIGSGNSAETQPPSKRSKSITRALDVSDGQ